MATSCAASPRTWWSRPARGEARHLRRARGPQGRDPPGHGGVMATVPRSLDEERAGLCRPRPAEHGVRRPAPGLHPAQSRQRQPDAPPHRRPTPRQVAEARNIHRRERDRRPVAHGLPRPAPLQIHSTNPIERVNKKVKRRADVVDIFPNEAAIVRLVGALLLELNDEWQLRHRYTQNEAMAELTPAMADVFPPQISTAAA